MTTRVFTTEPCVTSDCEGKVAPWSKSGICQKCYRGQGRPKKRRVAQATSARQRREILRHGSPEAYKAYTRETNLVGIHGLTTSEYGDQLAKQDGTCAICNGVNADGRSLSVDHNHKCCPPRKSCSKCWRGLLCQRCNHALGHFKDDPAVMRKAIAYVESNGVWGE